MSEQSERKQNAERMWKEFDALRAESAAIRRQLDERVRLTGTELAELQRLRAEHKELGEFSARYYEHGEDVHVKAMLRRIYATGQGSAV